MKKRQWMAVLLSLMLALTGCASGESAALVSENTESPAAVGQITDYFTDRDLRTTYEEGKAVLITLSGETAACDSDVVQVDGGVVTLKDEGTYILSGSLSGMIIVDAEKTDKLQLVLRGAEIASASSAAIYVRQADKVFLTLEAGTVNILENGGQFTAIDENNIDAVIYSKEDLTLNGEGELRLSSPAGHGIVSKDDLKIAGGVYQITAASHGMTGKDSLCIAGGDFTIDAGKDGIHAENADDASLGNGYVMGGVFNITAAGDGLSASGAMEIAGGEFTLVTGGGSQNAPVSSAQNMGWGGWYSDNSQNADDSESAKGVKAAGHLTISGGVYSLDTLDDALHTNGDLTITGGSFDIASGDDGMHADLTMKISGGVINITKSYEGIEGQNIEISGGEIALVASDDGLNAAGGNDQSGFGGRGGDRFGASANCAVVISGGVLRVNAAGDGLDSNGNLTITGGVVYVSGPENSGNGALDYGGTGTITGGVLLAAGASGMAQSLNSDTQGVIMVSMNTQQPGTQITLTDESGKEMIAWQSDKSYSSVVVSAPDILQGATYILQAGASSTTITMTSLTYGQGGGFGGGGQGGFGGGGFGGFGGGKGGGR